MIKQTKPYQFVRKIYYDLKNWDKTKQDRQIRKSLRPYHDLYAGKPCVVVGNGPSLTVEDLTRLHQNGIATFACNRIHLIFDQTPWRPTFYFMSDEKLIKQYRDDIEGVPADHRFFPVKYKDTVHNGLYYNELLFHYEHEGKFSKDAAEGIYASGSVTTEMIQFAYYFGFSEIYLIGVDFNYEIGKKLDNNTYAYQGENNYFVKGYLKPGEIAATPNIKANLLGFSAARKAIEEEGRIIQNATRGGKLEVFDRVDLDDLFEKWESGK